MQNSKFISHRH